ncbi:MAG: MgtC/SapB family protein [Bradyrhizobium sp.]|uniref:MgtC/SapB family protein n=1 Tax=Bradyrhizobium sp. TaxID=376 RepID=UPI0025BDD3B2|nr:MgtC/SapB family protein [Bradyrhizobium sp.]MBI5264242.1 MgtC/SapB family protein [Bradyrhizobium sp.]
MIDSVVLRIGVALGIGLLIGLERERRKNEGLTRLVAGLRTFAASSLAGAISFILGGAPLLAVVVGGVFVLSAVAYWRSTSEDVGLTTEVALVLTVLLGGLAMEQPTLAAGIAVTLAVLLAARTPLHNFVRSVLSEDEVRDGLIFASATLVVLPLLPNEAIGPYDVLNPRTIWTIVILVMLIGAVGHVSIRLLGPSAGLPVAGFASGFVSSIATIAAMGAQSRKAPELLGAATAGAVLSTVATIIQLTLLIGATSLPVLHAMLWPLLCAGVAAALYGAIFTIRAARQAKAAELKPGRAFSVPAALTLAVTIAAVMFVSAVLRDTFGDIGVVIGAAAAGLADTHSPAIAIAALAASGKMSAADTVIPILAAVSTNTVSKIIAAVASGGSQFAWRLIPGLVLVVAAAWAGVWLGHGLF